jgi:hypothetical protein
MNRWRAVAIGALFTGALLAQQQSGAAQVVLGAKLGMTWANIDEDPEELETGSLSSFGGGGFLRFGLGGISIQTELLALTRGAEFEDDELDGSLKLKLNYIDVSALLRLALGSEASFTPYLLVGPSLGFEISCDVEFDSDAGDFSDDCDDDEDLFERSSTDFGLTGGVGFELPLGPGNVLLEGRYTFGLTDLAKEDNTSAKNRSFGIFLGYAVPLGGSR